MSILTITVVKAKGLKAADRNGKSDPYVVLAAGPKNIKKSKVKKKTLDPVWKENFAFETKPGGEIRVTLWDYDKAKRDDFLGQLIIRTDGLELDTEKWFTLENRPGKDDGVSGELCLRFSFNSGAGAAGGPSGPSAASGKTAKGGPVAASAKTIPDKAWVTGPKCSSGAISAAKKNAHEWLQNGATGELDLSACKLTHLPPFMGKLISRVSDLNIGFNKLDNWPLVSPFSNLETLNLAGNQLTAVPSSIGSLVKLRELMLNGNGIKILPPQIGRLTDLEKLFIANNRLGSLPKEIGRLGRLEELNASGNLFRKGLPRTIGLLTGITVCDLSGSELVALPDTFPRMTRMIDLNLAANNLSELPPTMGNMTRLARLELSDNRLHDLPLSLGKCYGLENLMIERNPIDSTRMMEKYNIGTDHLCDFLQKRLAAFLADNPDLERLEGEYEQVKNKLKRLPPPKASSGAAEGGAKPPAPMGVEEKIALIKKDTTQLISEIKNKLTGLKRELMTASLERAVPIAHLVKALKKHVDSIKTLLPPIEKPRPPLISPGEDKLSQIRKTLNVAMLDVERTLVALQNALIVEKNVKMVVALVKGVKAMHADLN